MNNLRHVALALAVSLVVAGGVAVAGTTIGGDGEELVRARFESAAPLVEGNEVKVGGVVVGTVRGFEVVDGVAEVSFDLDEKAFPLHEDARLTIRPVSLLGERYVDLERGSPSAPELDPDAVIPLEQTATSVGLDEVLNTVDDPTGEGLKALVSTLGEGLHGNGEQVDEALRRLAPDLAQTQQLAAVLRHHNTLLARLVDNFEPVAGALATRDGKAMDELIAASDQVLAAVRERQGELGATLERLPETLSTLRTTLGHLRSTASDTTPTLAELRPLTDRLPEISGELHAFADALDPALASSEPVLREVDRLLGAAAPVADSARRAGPDLARTTGGADRLVAELTRNREELFSWVRYWALSTNGHDGLSHYFRVNASINPATLIGLLPTKEKDRRPPAAPRGPRDDKGGGLLDGLLGEDGLLDLNGLLGGLKQGLKGSPKSPTGLSERQEKNLLGLLLGGG
jgi:phospholipid/cholesterol/gamma-HCH transport system substrate-binding protein